MPPSKEQIKKALAVLERSDSSAEDIAAAKVIMARARAEIDPAERRDVSLPSVRASATPRSNSYDPEAHTVELVLATSYPVRRYDWWEDTYYNEQLVITPDAIDGERINKGVCPLLNAHSSWAMEDQLGRLEKYWIEAGQLIVLARFGTTPAALQAEAEVAAGNWRGVSVGYRRDEILKEVRTDGVLPTYKVVRWGVLEGSLVPVPADPDSGVRSAPEDTHPCVIHQKRTVPMNPTKEQIAAALATIARNDATEAEIAEANDILARARAAKMEIRAEPPAAPAAPAAPATPPAAPAADAARMSGTEALDFMEAARTAGVDDKQARKWVAEMTPDAARAELVRAAAAKQNTDTPPLTHGQAGRIGHDDRDTLREGLAEAMTHRLDSSVKMTEKGRSFRGMTLREQAKESLIMVGVREARNMNARELFREINSRAMSTSDFSITLSNVTGKRLQDAYQSASQTFKRWQRKATAADFKQISVIKLSGAPTLFEVPEGGEYQTGILTEAQEVYQLAKYGRLLPFTYEMFVNDDLGAFDRLTTMMGRAAGDFESDVAYAPLLANPTMGDGIALFHASHGNLAGSGAAPDETTLGAAEQAMGSQTTMEGTPMNIEPKYFLTGRKYAVTARKLFASTTPNSTADVNAFAGLMEPIIESRLNAATQPWFLAADPAQIDTIEYCYLEGEEGVFLDKEESFNSDAITHKVRLVFASKAIDSKGLYKNPGA